MTSKYFIIILLSLAMTPVSAQQLRLFSTEQRQAATGQQTVVMDFLERYFDRLPQVRHTTVATKMADDKVYFRNGRVSDLSQIADTMPLSINLAYRYYEVEWKKDGKPFVTIVFPAQYDLLLGMNQEEAQQKLKETIWAAPHAKVSNVVPKKLIPLGDSIYMAKTAYLEFQNFNDAIYYNKVHEGYRPVFDVFHLDYSAANLFQGLIANVDYRMYIEQSVYGLKTVSYRLTLRQWLDYCAAWGLRVFFAVEEQREDGLLALVIAQSTELGFNHMLSVVIPDKFVTNKNAVLKARMTAYIPTHNVKNLFKKENVNRRKIKWQEIE